MGYSFAHPYNQIQDPTIPEYEFFSTISQSQMAFILGVNIEAKPPSITLGKEGIKPKKGFITSYKDSFYQKKAPLIFTIKKKNDDIKIQPFMHNEENLLLKDRFKIYNDKNYTYIEFEAPALDSEKYREKYSCSLSVKNPKIDNRWHSVYSFNIFRQFAYKHIPDKKTVPKQMIIAKSDDFIIKADENKMSSVNTKFFEWEKNKGSKFKNKFIVYNANTFACSTLNYKVKVKTPGLYQLYILNSQQEYYNPQLTIYNGEKSAKLWGKKGLFENQWKQYGSIPIEIGNEPIIISIGNGIPRDKREVKISFEAIRLVRVANLIILEDEKSNGTYIAPSETFFIAAEHPICKFKSEK